MPSTVKSWPWSWIFAVLLTTLCLLTAVFYVRAPYDADPRGAIAEATAPGSPNATAREGTETSAVPQAGMAGPPETAGDRFWYKAFLLAAVSCAGVWFAYAFTGVAVDRRQEQVTFAYFFMLGSFAILMIPPFVKSQAIGSEPLGIVSGCVPGADAVQLRCYPDNRNPGGGEGDPDPAGQTPPVAATGGAGPAVRNNQWLVNIGGALHEQAPGACERSGSQDCKPGSPQNRVDVTGGVVVPLPFVIIALFGGAISLSRRLPEIQKRSEPGYEGTAAEPAIGMCEAREQLLFQIMQFISAPLIAITAHQLIEPERQSTAVGLAFLAGFGSESILLMIRGVANGLAPRSVTRAPAGDPSNAGRDSGETPSGNGLPIESGAASVIAPTTPLQLALTKDGDPALDPLPIRLCIDDEGLEPGSLLFTVDRNPVGLLADGCAELQLVPGQTYQIEARGRRAGLEVKGALALTPSADDEGRPIELVLG